MAKEKPKPPPQPPMSPEQSALLNASVAAEGEDPRHPTPDVEKPYVVPTVELLDLEKRVAKLEQAMVQPRQRGLPPDRGNVFDSRKGVPMPPPGWNEPAAAPADPEEVELVRFWVDPKGETQILERVPMVKLGYDDEWMLIEWHNGSGPQKFDRNSGAAEAPSLQDWRLAVAEDDGI